MITFLMKVGVLVSNYVSKFLAKEVQKRVRLARPSFAIKGFSTYAMMFLSYKLQYSSYITDHYVSNFQLYNDWLKSTKILLR